MTSSIVLLTALVAADGVGIPAASTQAPVARARLDLRAPSNCTSAADLIARVAGRSPRIQFFGDATTIGVRATFTVARPGEVSAELVLVQSGVANAQRRFATRTCAEAADAVALMIAVALDPVWVSEHPAAVDRGGSESNTGGAPSGTTGRSTTPLGTSAAKAGPAEKSIAKDPGQRPSPPILPARVSPPVQPAADSAATSALPTLPRTSVYLAGQTLWGPAPVAMPGVAAYAVRAMNRDALWSPAFVVGAFHAWRNDLAQPGGSASFALDAATVDACALRVRASIVGLRACAAALIGRLAVSGSDTDNPASFAKLFAAAGAAGIATVDLGSTVEVSARLGTGLTLWRDSYEFGTTVFHTVSRFTTSASIGIGLRLW